MFNQIDVLAVLEGKSEINKLFSVARLVDVSNNYVCKIVDGKIVPTNRKCFCVWDRNRPCSNCITHRAFAEKKQITKLQYLKNGVQLVLEIPVIYNGKNYIMELIKDITDSLVVNDEHHPDNTDINVIISELNTIAVMDPFTNLFNKKYIVKQTSITVGIYQFNPEIDTYETLLNNVDIAMYDNKKFKKFNINKPSYAHLEMTYGWHFYSKVTTCQRYNLVIIFIISLFLFK